MQSRGRCVELLAVLKGNERTLQLRAPEKIPLKVEVSIQECVPVWTSLTWHAQHPDKSDMP